ncbi:MAG TPA: 23S rRNA (uracil(1939)-C(5))-methyltransferase RlmD [Flavitalea sp.]|nr:23S rRNA (uracil(1939)-C(5))-methyltransferase RlmD [Flavitalea sp.]
MNDAKVSFDSSQHHAYLCALRKKRKHITLQKVLVTDYAAEGRSLARVDGKVIFIDDSVPGDVVDVRLGKNKKDWAEGKPVFFHAYSSDRVLPFCEHFGVCGGCQWQMLPYEKQLLYKQKQVTDNLQRIGRVELPAIEPIIGAAITRRYRNKIEYTFGNKRYLLSSEVHDQTINAAQDVAGYHAQGIFDKVVDIRECHLQAEPTNAVRLAVKEFAITHKMSFYDIRNHTGFLRTMQVRLCRTGELMINLVFGYEDVRQRSLVMDHIKETFPEITALLYTVNTKMNDSMIGLIPQVYAGRDHVIEMLENFRFKIGPSSFFQTNTDQGEKLYRVARSFAELSGREIVYDLYCGTGSIGIFVSPDAAKVIGVEMVEEAINDARENAVLNKISHALFFHGDVSTVCTLDFFAMHGKPDVIITDPPRAGMTEKLVEELIQIAAPLIVYVSCNPATQARDLQGLSVKYVVTKIQPVDMFPHTHHIENVVQLKLRR